MPPSTTVDKSLARISRRFTKDSGPYDGIEFEKRESKIVHTDGSVVFQMDAVEVPRFFSQVATDIAVSKYFRKGGVPGTGHEVSVKQLVERVVNAIVRSGEKQKHYFADDEARDAFADELRYLLITQRAAFNSPVWFNLGLKESYGITGDPAGNWAISKDGRVELVQDSYSRAQVSACFIRDVEDDLMSLAEGIKTEMRLFKYGSGSGTNFSKIRGKGELLSGGGESSGVMSFLRVYDEAAGSIKSGGTTRRAAKMVVLDVDHPDILEFIQWKAKEEDKVVALVAAGYDSDFNGEAYRTVSGQNANNSVRVTDEFMRAVEKGGNWQTRWRKSGEVAHVYKARDLMQEISQAAHRCADPGLHFHDTCNMWNTVPNTGPIRCTNPCCFVGETLVDTSEGLIPIRDLVGMSELPHAFAFDLVERRAVVRPILKAWVAGETSVLVDVITDKGLTLRCTPEHRFLLKNGTYVQARDLRPGMRLRKTARCVNTRRSDRRQINQRDETVWQNRFLWEQVNGPIPDGYEVHHKNGDPTDDRVSNFELRATVPHRSDHSTGANNGRFIDVEQESLLSVWEAVYASVEQNMVQRSAVYARVCELRESDHSYAKIADIFNADAVAPLSADKWTASTVHALYNKPDRITATSVTPHLWNAYIKAHGLTGAVPMANHARGIQGMTWEQFTQWADEALSVGNDRVDEIRSVILDTPVKVYDIEVDGVHNFAVRNDGADGVHSIVVHNSEFSFVDDTACNLASINLLQFLMPNGDFDVEGFRHACRVMILAQEILVDQASYPTKEIAERSHRLRPLGLGYANLGALLMQMGVPYDSDQGRAIAASITAIMGGTSWNMSAQIASGAGPFADFAHNREHMLRVGRMHSDAVTSIHFDLLHPDLWAAARASWNEAIELGMKFGYRNAQLTLLAPTGCLVPGSLVLTDRGLTRIEDLGDPHGAQWQDVEFSVQTNHGPQHATKFYVNGEADVISVTTERGYAITGTAKHQIKVVTAEGAWEWRRFDAIEQGDTVPFMIGGMFGAEQSVVLPACPPSYRTNHSRGVRTPETMSADLAWLVGLFMAEGSLHHKGLRLSLTTADHDLIEKTSTVVADLFGVEPTVESHGACVSVCLNSTQVRAWWQAAGFSKLPVDEGGKGAACRVPDAVLATNSPNAYGRFLNGVFSGDGTVISGIPSVTNKDRAFVLEIQTMMLLLGVPTRMDVQTGGISGKPVYRLTGAGRQFNRSFAENIGFSANRKAALVKADAGQFVRDDYIPVPQDLLDLVCPVGHARRDEAMRHMRAGAGISRLLAASLVTESRNADLSGRLGFYYDKVYAAELTGRSPTYDISVPENVTYIANGFVSHNTIGLLMDCDTTGIEPDFALVKGKKLAGGGYMKIVNQSVRPALVRLGYDAVRSAQIVDYVEEHGTVEGAPHLKAEHLPVFDCATISSEGSRFIKPMGHVDMMAAVQPFLCGAISKTVNMPESATVADIERTYVEAWRKGLKCIALYRDKSKGCQVLNAVGSDEGGSQTFVPAVRARLPKRRSGETVEATVAGHKVYIRTGNYDDGRLGEVFINLHKQGAPLRAWADMFSIAVSLGLQYGVPLGEFVDAFTFARFEPSGIVKGHEHIKTATSIVDYIFRSLAVDYLQRVDLAHVHPEKPDQDDDVKPINGNGNGRVGPAIKAAIQRAVGVDTRAASTCKTCGALTQRSGTCEVCPSCGETTGCG